MKFWGKKLNHHLEKVRTWGKINLDSFNVSKTQLCLFLVKKEIDDCLVQFDGSILQ